MRWLLGCERSERLMRELGGDRFRHAEKLILLLNKLK